MPTEELVFCCFAALHRVPFKISECSDYSSKTLPTRPEMERITLAIQRREPPCKNCPMEVHRNRVPRLEYFLICH
jgi:hypothetical protein